MVHQKLHAQADIIIHTPEHDRMWLDIQAIKAEVLGMKTDDIQKVEFYINGKLVKEFSKPPYLMTYDFGPKMKFHQLKVVARGVMGEVVEKSIHSLYVDDYQEVKVAHMMVPVVVTDRIGNYVKDLKKEDFLLEVDNRPQPVTYFSMSGKTQFHLILLIDVSSSMKDKIGAVKQAAKKFLYNLMGKGDKAMVVFFNHDVFEDTEFTSDINSLMNSIAMAYPFGATALYDAVAYCYRIFKSVPGHNIIILFSDGEDNSSHIDPYTLIKKVEKSKTTVYSIGNEMATSDHEYEALLAKIATTSGGLTFLLNDIWQIRKVYSKIRNDIKSQYMVYFSLKNIRKLGRFHTLKVRIKKHKGYSIRTLKGFYH
jgi:VWFA-related protein